MGLTAAHWIFVAVTAAMLLAMMVRRGVIILALIGIVALALISPNGGDAAFDHVIFAAQAMFRAGIVGGSQLFDTILLVGFMGALMHALREEGIDRVMMVPFAALMRGPRSAFVMLALPTYLFALFFWPTPSVLMIAGLLAPVAIRAGLSPLAAGMAFSMAGHGMALSADPVVQAAARLTGAPGDLPPSMILPISFLFSIVIGLVALGVDLLGPSVRRARRGEVLPPAELTAAEADTAPPTRNQVILAILIPAMLIAAALLSAFGPPGEADNGASVALLGGTVVVALVITCMMQHGINSLDSIVEMMTEGFYLVIRVFAPVIPVLGFFMIGSDATAPSILGEGTQGLVHAIGAQLALAGPFWSVVLPIAMVGVGVICGRDGVAFVGLPLAGAIAVMLSDGYTYQGAVLASLAQVVTIWVGSGTLLAWGGVRTVASKVGVELETLAHANRLPVIVGFASATLVAIGLLLHGA